MPVLLRSTSSFFTLSGRWIQTDEGTLVAGWAGASVSFRYTGRSLLLNAGPQTERKDRFNGGTPMLACALISSQGESVTKTFDPCPGETINLMESLEPNNEPVGVRVRLVLIDWASAFELASFAVDSEQSVIADPLPSNATRILTVGASITAGYKQPPTGPDELPHGSESAFPAIAVRLLDVPVATDLVAYPGWALMEPSEPGGRESMATRFFDTTPWSFERDPELARQASPDIIVIALGTNDDGVGVDIGKFTTSMQRFIGQLADLYESSLRHVVLLHPFPFFSRRGTTRKPRLARAYPLLAARLAKRHAQITFHERCITEGFHSGLTFDGLHPTQAGHELAARQLAELLAPLAKKDKP